MRKPWKKYLCRWYGVLMLVKDNDDDDVMFRKEKWLAAFLNIGSLFPLTFSLDYIYNDLPYRAVSRIFSLVMSSFVKKMKIRPSKNMYEIQHYIGKYREQVQLMEWPDLNIFIWILCNTIWNSGAFQNF